MRPISSLRLPVADLRPRGTLCARLQACHAALQIVLIRISETPLSSAPSICEHEFFPPAAIESITR